MVVRVLKGKNYKILVRERLIFNSSGKSGKLCMESHRLPDFLLPRLCKLIMQCFNSGMAGARFAFDFPPGKESIL